MINLDILVIGAGTAGEYATRTALKLGRSTGLVERARVGGACVFDSCIPTKAMVHAARAWKKMRNSSFFALPAPGGKPQYKFVKEAKDLLIESIGTGRDERFRSHGAHVFRGEARFLSTREIVVDDERVQASQVIIATGSSPAVPPIEGLQEAGYTTHIGALQLEHPPERLAIIGGGPVGLEFAQIFNAFGSRIDIYEASSRLAANEDAEVSTALTDSLTSQGIGVHVSCKVNRVARTSSGKLVTVEGTAGTVQEEYDEILVSVGRLPVMQELDLAVAGVETGPRGIKVDASMRTSISHIWAAGDITGGPYYTYVANEQGKTAVMNATGQTKAEVSYDILPRAVFCDPEIASVGLTEEQARQQGLSIKTGKYKFEDMTRPMISDETEGFIKIIAEAGSGFILGGHFIGVEASTLVHEVAAAMSGKLVYTQLGNLLHSYPTLSEGIRYACEVIR